ncbi:MAG: transposase [Cyanobacteria bacterium RI_101]|nr:transposase [Cyanobacteria bacterium RI_101]
MTDRYDPGHKEQEIELILVESTGGLEREWAQHWQQRGLPVSVLNPKRARNFAKAEGRLGKTDKIDAQALARFG